MNAILQLVRDTSSELQLLSDALTASPECMAIVENGTLVYANPAFAELFGCMGSMMPTGKALSDFVPGDRVCNRQQRPAASLLKEECGYQRCEFKAERTDGARLQLEAQCARFTSKGRDLRVMNIRDITYGERRRVVRESDRRFRAVVDEAVVGILQCTIDGHVLESNPAAERILGYTPLELRGMSFRNFIYSEDLTTASLLFEELVAAHKPCQKELRYQRKDHAWGWARLTLSLVQGPDAKPEFAILMIEDVTEYKRAEQQLRESQRMEAIGRLVGGVAHDFNNLLTGIMLYSDLIKGGLGPESRLTGYIDEIRMASEHGGALIQQLLSVGKRQVAEPRVLSLNEIVGGMTNLLARLIGEHIELQTDLDSTLWAVKMDPTQVQQLLLNLVINGRDAMPEGGRIVVSTRNAPAPSTQGNDSVELSVQDNGCGMSSETLAHVYEPFFTTKAGERGNGLGLTTVHGIVRESGGSIAISSQPGEGTTVTVRLPSAGAEQLSTSCAVPEIPGGGRETILLVEDNEAVRCSAQRILHQCGYRVLEASNGREAIKIFQEQREHIHLLLTDLQLPGGDGRDIASKIQQMCPELPVIFTSGYENNTVHQDVNEPVVIFRKPFAGKALLRKIRQVLDQAAEVPNQSDQKRKLS
jgi:two-component system cell cycle sensor histidine kinase/response regulator CckA